MTQTGGTKYVFAGTREPERDVGVKVCPRCGQVLFEDMDTCFDCLYSFKKDVSAFHNRPEPLTSRNDDAPPVPNGLLHTPAPDHVGDLLRTIEIDEIDEDDDMPDVSDDVPMANARHRKREPDMVDDTIDFSELSSTKVEPPQTPQFYVVIRTKEMQVHIPVPQHGLTVGRGEGNDVVLHSRLVSRQHLRLVPQEDGVTIQDCGATNPTLIQGIPLEGSARVAAGDTVDICGTTIELEGEPSVSAA